ncbi:MAG: hypothetical protein HZB53_01535 [Chloroflexi bacterium]|nr:hypothetical protein [Chloroflexota bacterium]
MGIILMLHSLVRFAILVIAAVAILKLGYGWLAKRPFDGMDRGLTSGFSGLMDAQALLGLIVLIGLGFTPVRIEHAITMIIAVVVAHLPMRWKTAPDAIRQRNNLLAIVASLVLVIVGLVIVTSSKGI